MPKQTKSSGSTSGAVRQHYGYATTGKPTQHCPPGSKKAPSRGTGKKGR